MKNINRSQDAAVHQTKSFTDGDVQKYSVDRHDV